MSANIEDRLVKMREERAAREKARIEMLRELNRNKYNKKVEQSNFGWNSNIGHAGDTRKLVKASVPSTQKVAQSSVPATQKVVKSSVPTTQKLVKASVPTTQKLVKSNENDKTRRPTTAPMTKPPKDVKKEIKSTDDVNVDKKPAHKNIPVISYIDKNKNAITNKINNDKLFNRKPPVSTDNVLAEIKPFKRIFKAIDPKLTRKSMVYPKPNVPAQSRKSMIPKIDTTKESVFDRLYKPKFAPKKTVDEVEKLKTDPNYLRKVVKNSDRIIQRFSCYDPKEVKPVRRSISAVHFKRIGKNELGNCIHKWSSIGDKLHNQHLAIDEGEPLKEDKVTSAVKSERKKVMFLTPKFNTPAHNELHSRLKSWLHKRGKSFDAYQHLQCFGVHHLLRANEEKPKFDSYVDENKENIALDSDSDNGSFTDNMGDQKVTSGGGDIIDIDKWRTHDSIQTEYNDTADLNVSTVTSADTFETVDDLLMGSLNDLTELLKEGYDPEQAVLYLRAIRSHFPDAPRVAAYWECRAALEERRGDLHSSVQCWEKAIATGTEPNIAEANLDSLLKKFMQLNITPSAAAKKLNPKLVDVKNVFKSAIIRFAVSKNKLRQSEAPVYTVTPVRRSGRLTMCPTPLQATPLVTPRVTTRVTPSVTRKPLHICESMNQVSAIAPTHVFTVNENLVLTP